MKEATGIRQLIVDIVKKCSKPVSLEVGVVKSVSPLKLGLVNDKKMTLTDTDIVVPSRFEGKLEKSEKLHLLVLNNGSQYYVLDKV